MPLVLSHTNSQGVATCNLLSAAHLEPVFMYKGAQIILFSFEPKGAYVYVKVRRIFMQYRVNNCWERYS